MRKRKTLISDELSKLETMEEMGGLNDQQYLQKLQLMKESLSLLEQEEAYWAKPLP